MLLTEGTFLGYFLAASENGAQPWWDYPGLEVWKFFNLFVFLATMVYVLKRPLTGAFRSRREAIRRELIRAQEERDRALAKLADVQSRFERLDAEVADIKEQSVSEARAERERIARATESEMLKLRDQALREIASASKIAKHDLRVFAAQQSMKLAEELIRREIRPEDDMRLIDMNVEQLGRD
jgi:F0F1-type ATP synthase membrane subunit b/b'